MSQLYESEGPPPSITFFTTAGCHLCEQAMAVLARAPLAEPVPVELVDIAESEDLTARYGLRIPVLVRGDTGDELGWPFDEAAVIEFLR